MRSVLLALLLLLLLHLFHDVDCSLLALHIYAHQFNPLPNINKSFMCSFLGKHSPLGRWWTEKEEFEKLAYECLVVAENTGRKITQVDREMVQNARKADQEQAGE